MTKSAGIAAIVSLALMTACTNDSGVVPYGDGSYLITRSEKSLATPAGVSIKATVLKEANQFCGGSGHRVEVVSETAHDMKVFRADPNAEIRFRCVDKN